MAGGDIRVDIIGDSGEFIASLEAASRAADSLADNIDKASDSLKQLDRAEALNSILGSGWSSRTGAFLNRMEAWRRATNEQGDAIQNLENRLRQFGYRFDETGRIVRIATSSSGGWFSNLTFSWRNLIIVAVGLIGALSALAPVFGSLLPIIPALTLVFSALITPFATLAAIAVSLLGPLSALALGFGALGGAAFIAGKFIFSNLKQFPVLAGLVKDITKGFSQLGETLGHRLAPIFEGALVWIRKFVDYANQLAHMSLSSALDSIATKGVRMLTRVNEWIFNLVKKPIRLVFEFAFGAGGQNAQAALGKLFQMWKDLFLGSTQRIEPHGNPRGPIVVQHVPGAFQPIIDWFNRQNFSKYGDRWGHEIGSAMAKGLAAGFASAATHVFHWFTGEVMHLAKWIGTAGGQKQGWLDHDIAGWFGSIWGWIKKQFSDAWDAVKSKALGVWDTIKSKISSALGIAARFITSNLANAWHAVGRAAGSVWQTIQNTIHSVISTVEGWWNGLVKLVESVLTVHISWPSPPGWLSGLGGLIPHLASGGIVTRPTLAMIGESGPEAVVPLNQAPGAHPLSRSGGDTHVHLHFSGMPLVGRNEIDAAIRMAIQREWRRGNGLTTRTGAILR